MSEAQAILGTDYTDRYDGIDAVTGALEVIPYEHHEIHAGSHYNLCDYVLGVSNTDTVEFVITTPNTQKLLHLLFEVFSSLGATVELFEGAADVVGGTAQTPRNNNRTSSNTSGATIVKDPTSITDGTRASGYLAGAGRNAGFTDREKEFILAPNTTYLLRITSLANSNNIAWCGEWYEHTSKN